MTVRLLAGDCREVMAGMDAESVDAIVTDPPYGLEFMGKEWDRLGDVGKTSHSGIAEYDGSNVFGRAARVQYNGSSNAKCAACGKWRWDYPERKCVCASPQFANAKAHQARLMQEWHESWAREAYRVLKPGGHLLAFGGDRTVHRLACAIEDSGFEIRGKLAWIHGQGFPKNLNVSNALRNRIPLDSQCACAQRSMRTPVDSLFDYPDRPRSDDAQLLDVSADAQDAAPSANGAHAHSHGGRLGDVPASAQASIYPDADNDRPSNEHYQDQTSPLLAGCQSNGSTPSDTAASTSPDEPTAMHRTALGISDTSHLGDDSVPSSLDLPDSGYPNLPHCSRCGKVVIPEGLGTALKPAHEDVVVARKPLIGTVSRNVSEHGTGALNIDATRIGVDWDTDPTRRGWQGRNLSHDNGTVSFVDHDKHLSQPNDAGRWPANVVLSHHEDCREVGVKRVKASAPTPQGGMTRFTQDGANHPRTNGGHAGYGDPDGYETVTAWECHESCPIALLDAQSGERKSGTPGKHRLGVNTSATYGAESRKPGQDMTGYGDTGGASRFFFRAVHDDDGVEWYECEDCGRTYHIEQLTSGCPHCGETMVPANGRTGEASAETRYTDRGATNFAPLPGQRRHDNGGASRFFYCAKASRAERNAGLDGMPERAVRDGGAEFGKMTMWNGENGDEAWRAKNPNKPTANHHPTVKPVALMRWLVRLVTPPSGTVLDPFMGSGTTGIACVHEGFDFIGIEQDAEYGEIARRRIAHAQGAMFAAVELA